MRVKSILAVGVIVVLYPAITSVVGQSRPSHEDTIGNATLTAMADALKLTVVTPHLEQSITTGTTVLWCSTFQLAWNEVCALIGEAVHLEGEPPMVAVLNKRTAKKEHLDEASYVALSGFIRDGILQRIPQALKEKFGGRASPWLFPGALPGPLRPQDIVAYAYLFKDLRFAVPFEPLDEPLEFGSARVAAFGTAGVKRDRKKHAAMLEQVAILDYVNGDDFVIELKSTSKDDRLVLAKVPPAETLERTIAAIQRRIKDGTPEATLPGDVLAVPKLNFDIVRRYEELLRKGLKVKNPDVAKDLVILEADQRIRFRLDETGARLLSESQITFGCSASGVPAAHVMVFDEPFLILMKRRGATLPYFALWVDNVELLVAKD